MIKSLIISLCLIVSLGSSTIAPKETSYVNNDVTYIDWRHSGSGYWTQSKYYNVYNDFDWAVTRTQYPDNYGYYTFRVWFFSQSYYWDGYNASYTSTNIRNIDVYLDGVAWTSDYSQLGITFNKEYVGIQFKSKKANPYFKIKWGAMSAK